MDVINALMTRRGYKVGYYSVWCCNSKDGSFYWKIENEIKQKTQGYKVIMNIVTIMDGI